MDPAWNLIKGGVALLAEKAVAAVSDRHVIVVDESNWFRARAAASQCRWRSCRWR